MEVLSTRIRGPSTTYLYRKSAQAQAPLFFFLHGFPDDAHTFSKQFEFFTDYDLLAPFNRGTPPSEMAQDEGRYGPDSLLLDYLHLLHEVDPRGEKKVLIMGHDIGALYAWDLARHLGTRCAGLIIENGASIEQIAVRISNWRQVLKSWYIFIFQIPGSKLLWESFEKKFIDRAYARGGAPQEKRPEKVGEGVLLYREAFKEVLKFLFTKRRGLGMEKLSAPVLVLCAKEDPYLEEVGLDELEILAHQVTVRYVEGGHWAHQVNADKINQLIAKFLRQ